MTPAPFAHILVGYLPTEQGADARALGVDLAATCGADLLLASIVSAVWIENIGEQTGPAVIHSGERERAGGRRRSAAPGVRRRVLDEDPGRADRSRRNPQR